MSSIFSQIVSGELPAHKVIETEDFLAFLDIYPVTKGHTLVITKKEIPELLDLDDELYIGLWLFAKEVAKALKKATNCRRVAFTVLGFQVPHAHIHLIPLNDEAELDFSKERIKAEDTELLEVLKKIREYL